MSMENELIKSIVNLIKDSSKIMYNQGEAAEALGMSPSALTQAIKRGDGPRFTCIGGRAKYYTKAALITFAESMPSYASMDEFFRATSRISTTG